MTAYGLPSEPWLFVIDRTGKVSTVLEGPFSVQELDDGGSEGRLTRLLARSGP